MILDIVFVWVKKGRRGDLLHEARGQALQYLPELRGSIKKSSSTLVRYSVQVNPIKIIR